MHFVSWWIQQAKQKGQKSTSFAKNNPIVVVFLFCFVILRSMVEGAGSTDIAVCANQLTIPLTKWPSGWVLIFLQYPFPPPISSTISSHHFRRKHYKKKTQIIFWILKLLSSILCFLVPSILKFKKQTNKRRFGPVNNAPSSLYRPPLWKHSALFKKNFFTGITFFVFI